MDVSHPHPQSRNGKNGSENSQAEEVKPEGFAFRNWQDWVFATWVFLRVGIAITATPFPTSSKHSDHLIKMSTVMTKCITTETSMINGYKKTSISALALAAGMSRASDVFWSEALWLPQSRRCYLNLSFLYSSLAEVLRRGRARVCADGARHLSVWQ